MINMAFVCYYMKCSKRRLSDIPSSEWISSFRYREKDNPDLVVLDMKIPYGWYRDFKACKRN